MGNKGKLRSFLFPPVTKKFFLRIVLVTVGTYIFFAYICLPFRVEGFSMEPTYGDGSFNFCFRPAYLFSEPERPDVVVLRLAGEKVMLLKRVVASEGDRVQFRKGKLLVNGKQINEPYVRFPYDWNLPVRRVEKGHIYVVGDNRTVPIEQHDFGQTSVERVVGAPVW